jgi:dTDP-4-amino-4,6-dideoxygalactose transaminase
MDSAVGDELLDRFQRSDPKIQPLANLQASVGLRQLRAIDGFNQGARRNAEILTEKIGEVPGVRLPRPTDGNHIYVYYPLTVDADKRDDLREYLLRHGIDTKKTDMSSCARLAPFADAGKNGPEPSSEAKLLEICVYPVLSEKHMDKIARTIRSWAGLPPL